MHVIILTCPIYVDACILTCPKKFLQMMPPPVPEVYHLRRGTVPFTLARVSSGSSDRTTGRRVGVPTWTPGGANWNTMEMRWGPAMKTYENPMKTYGNPNEIPMEDIWHGENYENTSCPGNTLQPKVGEVWWESDGVKNDVDIVYLLYYDAWCQDLFW